MQREMLDTKPWYRHFWPWVLIALPLSAVIAGLTTVWIASHETDGLVVDDYYKAGRAINRVLDRDQRANELQLQANLELQQGELNLQLRGKAKPQGGLKLALLHPTRANKDIHVELVPGSDGHYKAYLPPLSDGAWHVQIEPQDGEWRLTGRLRVPHQKSLYIDAAG